MLHPRDELAALGKAIKAEPSHLAANALKLIALTALRRGEAYGLRWREIDFGASCLRLRSRRADGQRAQSARRRSSI